VLLFIGSSGVGKTMLAKAIADIIVKDPNGFIRIDMSEYALFL
jgi:ATP-dependent Clp protease ATP-binding subunit ClpA